MLKSIKGKKNFSEVFERGKGFSTDKCRVIFCFKEDNNNQNNNILFFGVTISKKTAKRAVVRNRIKRLMREGLRRIFSEDIRFAGFIDKVVVVWKSAPAHPGLIRLNDVLSELKFVFSKAEKFYYMRSKTGEINN